MYRNYDGSGNGFSDVSLQATSQDQAKLSVYAAERSGDHSLTVMAINKTGTDLTSHIHLIGAAPTAAEVYPYSGASPSAIIRAADLPITGSGFSATFPTNSITLFVMTTTEEIPYPTLTITKNGGDGSVLPNIGTITWTGSTGTASYSTGTSVTLIASAGAASLFGGWTGCNAINGNQCSVIMDASTAVTASFTPQPCGGMNAYMLNTGYETIQQAYDAASRDTVAKTSGTNTEEELVFGRPIDLRLKGGYDCEFLHVGGMTTVASLTVSAGRLTVENLVISGP